MGGPCVCNFGPDDWVTCLWMRFAARRGSAPTVSLLTHLDAWDKLSLTRWDADPPTQVFPMPSIIHSMLSEGTPPKQRYVPSFDLIKYKTVSMKEWWNDAIWILPGNHTPLARKDFALGMADQDGGAHVDASLNRPYFLAKQGGGMQFPTDNGFCFALQEMDDVESQAESARVEGPSVVHAVLRQMAHEILNSEFVHALDYLQMRSEPPPFITVLSPSWLPKDRDMA